MHQMIQLKQEDGRYAIYGDEQRIGIVELYDNPCHMKNCYVKLKLERLEPAISAGLFRKIHEIAKRPLQIMVRSDNGALTEFLVAGGFERRRRCYEVEARTDDYIGGSSDVPLVHSRAGEPDYERCCRMMLDYYVETHRAVNPWTSDFEAFRRSMPVHVVFTKADDKIVSLAFIEENEIAYVCGTDKRHFANFARSLVTWVFEQYETCFFESDDCDWAAMQLRSTFNNLDETSLDTYVYETGTVPGAQKIRG
ncbi:MAG: hypothetical protein ACI3V3_01275 [Faecousia sp.]